MTDLAPHGFSAQQKAALAAPLNADNVKEREQAGRTLSYLEGWKAVEEANRIFGFDGWTRQTVEIKCVAERERKIGKAPSQRDGWGVSYICKVQITVLAGTMQVTREGIGAGHGIDADLGVAHESAIKEAETDAMKRALMTFGNQFGLALYDKAQTNVVRLPKKNSRDLYERMEQEIDGIDAADELLQWGSEATERIAVLPADWVQILRSRFAEKLAALRQHQATEVVWDEDEERPAPRQANLLLSPPPQRARPKALAALGQGDVLLVTRLDRLARSTRDLLNVLATISDKGAGFRSLADAWADTTSAHGRLMITILGGLAEFERSLILARTGEGRTRAMARGVRFGRKPKLTTFQVAEAIRRRDAGEAMTDIGRSYGVSHSTISRLRFVPSRLRLVATE